MPIVGRADQKNSGITAHTPRANTAKTSGHNGAPLKHTALPHPATTKHSGRLAVIVEQEAAEPSSQPVLLGTSRFDMRVEDGL